MISVHFGAILGQNMSQNMISQGSCTKLRALHRRGGLRYSRMVFSVATVLPFVIAENYLKK